MITARSKRLLALALIASAGAIALALGGGGAERSSFGSGKDANPRAAESSAPSSRPSTERDVSKSPAESAALSSASIRGTAAPARQRTARAASPSGELIAKAAWGSGKGELGRSRPAEGAPESPSSLAVDPSGRIHVLDQVNSRVQIFKKGEEPITIPLPSDTFEDISVDSRGNTFVLDRGATGTVAVIDESGKLARSIPLAGQNVPEAAGVTGVFARDDGLWVEVEHANLVRIAYASGEPDLARPIVQGRFSPDGSSLLLAALAGPQRTLVS